MLSLATGERARAGTVRFRGASGERLRFVKLGICASSTIVLG
jgi:hypothetical protein